MALGVTDHVWSIGELFDAALATLPVQPTDRRRGVAGNQRRSVLEAIHGSFLERICARPYMSARMDVLGCWGQATEQGYAILTKTAAQLRKIEDRTRTT